MSLSDRQQDAAEFVQAPEPLQLMTGQQHRGLLAVLPGADGAHRAECSWLAGLWRSSSPFKILQMLLLEMKQELLLSF